MAIAPFIRNQLVRVFLLLVIVIIVGTLFYITVEKFTVVDAFYFTTMTLTTVGFGDIVPLTTAGKLFTAVYAFVGIGIFFGFISTVFTKSLQRRTLKR